MDKFEMEQFGTIRDVVADLQTCFIDGDAYSRSPSANEWRRATALAHRLTLLCFELYGYASATRQYNVVSIRERLHVVSNEGGEENKNPDAVGTSGADEGVFKFTEQEILKMPRKFRKLFRTNKQTAHVRQKDGDVYEIRMQIDGHRITASAKYLDLAKERFIKKLREYNERGAGKKETAKAVAELAPLSVSAYALHYLETFKRPNISEKHFSNLCGIVRRHVARFFGETLMRDITATDCQQLLNELAEQGKGRTVEEVKNLLSWICAAAVADRILTADVMAHVQTLPHRRTVGKSIPREYVRAFLAREPQDRAELCLRLLIYTGMRPCELSALTFDDVGFVSITTAKRKKWETQDVRRIPLHPALSPYAEEIRAALPVHYRVIVRTFKRYFPVEYQLYDLRHTFTTQAQQSHCYKPWVDYVTGHKANGNTTDRVYTHWEDDFQREEIAKIEF